MKRERGEGHRQFCSPKFAHRVITCFREPHRKKPLDLTHSRFENRSKITCSRVLQSFALPDEAVELHFSSPTNDKHPPTHRPTHHPPSPTRTQHKHTNAHAHTNAQAHANAHAHVFVFVHARIDADVDVRVHVNEHVYMYVYVFVFVFVLETATRSKKT